MTDQVLDILKLVLLALLYLFFARVLWAVWSEVRAPADARQGAPVATPPSVPASTPAPTPAAGVPAPADRRSVKPTRGKGGVPARLVVLEPKERRGTTFAVTGTVTVGRDAGNTIVITDDEYVSGHHASIRQEEDRVVVDDQGSRNGTFVNANKITARHTLRRGDRIQIGYTVLEAQ